MIDDRLREILKAASISGKYGDTHEATYLELIAQIKQCFAEEGYERTTQTMQSVDIDGNQVTIMTGQEWYDRFEKEAPGSTEPHVLEAARKAAGLTDA